MRDRDVVALLKRHKRSFGRTPGRSLVDRSAVRVEIGDEQIADIDEWVEQRGGTIEHALVPRSRSEHARARVRRLPSGTPFLEQYEVPRTLLAPSRDGVHGYEATG